MAAVRFESVSKVFPGGTAALDGLDLEIADGELVALVGPSGCGKTTALRILAGLEELTSGSVRIGGRSVDHLPPRDRDVAMVFQSYALYPHLTVARNIGFPLRLRRMPPDEIDRRVREAARILDLEPLLDRKPGQLSGGQRQRVAMGRAIVRQPSLFLMDEPLSNLDAKLRVQMRAEIARLQRRLGVTTVYVTHDQVEAMTMGDRVAVLNAGRLQQFDAPRALYERPANMFVAGFIGSPPMNLFEATLEGGEDGVDVRLGDQTVRLPRGVLAGRPGLRGYLGCPMAVGIRPEDVFESGRGTPGGGATLRVDVDLVEALGAETIIHFRLGAPAVVPVGDSDDIGGGGGGRGAARFDARTQVGPGQTVEVTVDPERLHFFDPATSEAVR